MRQGKDERRKSNRSKEKESLKSSSSSIIESDERRDLCELRVSGTGKLRKIRAAGDDRVCDVVCVKKKGEGVPGVPGRDPGRWVRSRSIRSWHPGYASIAHKHRQ